MMGYSPGISRSYLIVEMSPGDKFTLLPWGFQKKVQNSHSKFHQNFRLEGFNDFFND